VQQKQEMKCTMADDCDEQALYFANVTGIEMLCCESHGAMLRTEQHGADASSWFCRELNHHKGDDCMWYIAWKLPEELRDDFGLLVWLWYPLDDQSDGEETTSFNLYREKDESIELPEGARWEKITRDEAATLIGQLIYENQRGKPPFIIGFAPDEPFDRPDPSMGYTLAKHSCQECTSDMTEPFCFNYKKKANARDLEATWERSNLIEYKPERGTIRAIRHAAIRSVN
jgi:predicted outer membrane lipoprotein